VIVFSPVQLEILSPRETPAVFQQHRTSIAILFLLSFELQMDYRASSGNYHHTIDDLHKGEYVKRIPIARTDEWGQLADLLIRWPVKLSASWPGISNFTRRLEERGPGGKLIKSFSYSAAGEPASAAYGSGYLTANLAHDLGTPLHSIAGWPSSCWEHDQLGAGCKPET